jgi:hypothetical protein
MIDLAEFISEAHPAHDPMPPKAGTALAMPAGSQDEVIRLLTAMAQAITAMKPATLSVAPPSVTVSPSNVQVAPAVVQMQGEPITQWNVDVHRKAGLITSMKLTAT